MSSHSSALTPGGGRDVSEVDGPVDGVVGVMDSVG